ncbi:MAG: glycosyl hydrolase family 18 protein [Bacteroidia bacterium]|nr:glycosyl hydrolase family 18 protein [Bacteroidia bacterium]
MRFISIFLAAALLCGTACGNIKEKPEQDGVVIGAYVMGVGKGLPDPSLMTHINYAFAHVNETFDGVFLPDAEGLEQVVSLKKHNRDLKVLLSVGGWGSGRFSEMAADAGLRSSFAEDCAAKVKKYRLDGIDIDWEYPTVGTAGISFSPDDTDNFTLLMRDIRAAIGEDKLLTLASVCTARYVDFKDILPYIDYVNVMAYDMGGADGGHHAALHRSENAGFFTAEEAVDMHLAAGVPPQKIVLGMPFYGRGERGYTPFGASDGGHSAEVWDDVAMVPLLFDDAGRMVFGFENVRSITAKCDFLKSKGLRGGMYWEYNVDNDSHDLARTVHDCLADYRPSRHVLVVYEGAGQHKPFTDAALAWMTPMLEEKGIAVAGIHNMNCVTAGFLDSFDAVIQLDFPPYTWPKAAEDTFIDYIENGKGGYIGFHHATLLGNFDGYPMWRWFSDFMGGITYRNYIAPLADGDIHVEAPQHPVMEGVDSVFTILDDEWYIYDRSPRETEYIQVLASVDENSYRPDSDIRMGDHPAVWTNTAVKSRNVYFIFGHSPKLLENPNFRKLFTNSIDWVLCNAD